MTTETTMETNTTTSWAETRGRLAAERRAAREAELLAQAAAEGARFVVSIDELRSRFAATAALVLSLIDAHAAAAGIRVIAESVHPPRIALSVPVADLNRNPDRLILHLEDDTVRVTVSSHARSDQLFVDLADPVFDPDAAASRIATRWFAQVEASLGGPHVDPR